VTTSAERLDQILDVLTAFARQDFSPRIPVSPELDELDAVATGINMLAEELDGEVASRQELEAAYTALKATQGQLMVAEKLAAVGQLANGVAHEINNPASWVILNVDHARSLLADARGLGLGALPAYDLLAGIDAALADVQEGMIRIRAVVDNLRSFTRLDHVQGELDLNEVIRGACQLAQPAFRGVARLVLDLGEIPALVGDRTRLGQMVTNLLVNAAQAIGDGGADHEIAITTVDLDDHVLLAIEDTGPGIPEELRERVFDPYFTTKSFEVGTGLGLALVREIVMQHDGDIRIAASTRGGARVEVRIPVRHGGSDQPAQQPVSVATPTRRARLLLIDDEPMLLRSLTHCLAGDHETVSARGGEEALSVLARDRNFDLVLCDLQMPGVDGVAVYDAIARSAPEILERFAVMSGGVVTARARQFIDRVRPSVIDKPIDVEALLSLVAARARGPA
jgi:signal transduction histidine kinase/CheY-like chemotaxis protein